MSNKAIGIITGNFRCDALQTLSQTRSIAAVPFGGRYRLLDFALSNMVNSGLRTVGIITPQQSRAILDQLGGGKSWFLDRKSGGLFILPGSHYGLHSRNNKFPLKDMANNIEFLTRDFAENVIISTPNIITNLDYKPILSSHMKEQADITLLYLENKLEKEEEPRQLFILSEDKWVTGLEEGIAKGWQKTKYFANTLIIKRQLLIDILKGYEHIEYLDLMDVVKENCKNLRILSYPIHRYFGRVFSLQSYYQHSMNLLNPSVQKELFMGENRIHTKIKDNPPTKYGEQVKVRDSLVSSGCNIQGEVDGSIIFRGVQVEPGAIVRNSIIMHKSKIKKGVVLENVVLDKYVKVRANTVIKGEDSDPIIIRKSHVV